MKGSSSQTTNGLLELDLARDASDDCSAQWPVPRFHNLHAWVDPNVTQQLLFHGPLVGQQWIQLVGTTATWLVAPLLIGLWTLQRSEVK